MKGAECVAIRARRSKIKNGAIGTLSQQFKVFRWASWLNPNWTANRELELLEFYGGKDTSGWQHAVRRGINFQPAAGFQALSECFPGTLGKPGSFIHPNSTDMKGAEFAIAQTPTKQPALRLSRTKNLHFAKATFPGFSAIEFQLDHNEDLMNSIALSKYGKPKITRIHPNSTDMKGAECVAIRTRRSKIKNGAIGKLQSKVWLPGNFRFAVFRESNAVHQIFIMIQLKLYR
jgi:hypothetical protein